MVAIVLTGIFDIDYGLGRFFGCDWLMSVFIFIFNIIESLLATSDRSKNPRPHPRTSHLSLSIFEPIHIIVLLTYPADQASWSFFSSLFIFF